jgi:hypothetical protein
VTRNRSVQGVHEELLAPSMGLAPDGASLPLFNIVPDDFGQPARNAAMASVAGIKTCSNLFSLQPKGNAVAMGVSVEKRGDCVVQGIQVRPFAHQQMPC